ncbi:MULTISPECIES: hypothetical protein [Acidiphilium]|uniref:hypothetical protein n=1 Tax=Acidiphilium TaxID=522 RepID=UPI00257D61AF|nr:MULTISPECIES: hypothetical protein [Acidiphilium]HQT86775.1 hypothetical protein [Acidiphilium rubrum]
MKKSSKKLLFVLGPFAAVRSAPLRWIGHPRPAKIPAIRQLRLADMDMAAAVMHASFDDRLPHLAAPLTPDRKLVTAAGSQARLTQTQESSFL